MKRIITAVFIIAATAIGAFAGTPVTYDRLPENARKFIARHITQTNAVKIEKDMSDGRSVYDVEFADGTEIEFDAGGQWIKYEAPDGYAVPSGFIPEKISNYVLVNYPDRVVKEVERNADGYKVEVTGDVDLYFNNTGNCNRTHSHR